MPVMPPLRPHEPLTQFYAGWDSQAATVRELFDSSAPYYDRICAAMSFGTGWRYRRDTLRRAGLKPGMRVLDVATGTGLVLAAALAEGVVRDALVGLDPSRRMLDVNRMRYGQPLVQGRGEALPFADASFDLVSMGYALRHVEDLRALFAECRRVLRPGGRLLILEITRPRSSPLRVLLGAYLGVVVPALAFLTSGRREPRRLMQYYWATIAACVSTEVILAALAEARFATPKLHVQGAILTEYLAQKPI
ncbi:MAG: methyltransferase domain-containing protein [Luteitalea sp.]|nr:methyltransferase domain-containing protein [Luteitalea sp.]